MMCIVKGYFNYVVGQHSNIDKVSHYKAGSIMIV